MGVGFLSFVVYGAISVALIVAIVLLLRRRGPNHPACGACGYDVTASVGHTERCPECGAAFLDVGITPPSGRRSPARIAAAVVLMIVLLGCLGSSVVSLIAVRSASQSLARARAQTQAMRQQAEQAAADAQREADEAARQAEALRQSTGAVGDSANGTTSGPGDVGSAGDVRPGPE